MTLNPSPRQPTDTALEQNMRDIAVAATAHMVLLTGGQVEATPLTFRQQSGVMIFECRLGPVNILFLPYRPIAYMYVKDKKGHFLVHMAADGTVPADQMAPLLTYLRSAGMDVPEPTETMLPDSAQQQSYQLPSNDGNTANDTQPSQNDYANHNRFGCRLYTNNNVSVPFARTPPFRRRSI